MKISFIATYPPRTCGIATFTQNLFRSVAKNGDQLISKIKTNVVAITDKPDDYLYPPEVSISLQADCHKSYYRVAEELNRNADLVVLQHEYGIYGGQDGAYILSLLESLQVPAVATLHTVLKNPSSSQKHVLQQLGKLTRKLIVMSRLAKQFLEEIYQIPSDKIAIIEHGVPDFPLSERSLLRKKLGFEKRKVLFTFGLLGRGKGIETAINALPAIVKKHPETLYIVLGKTHPGILRENGEEYREHLLDLAKQKGVEENVQFINAFADEAELWDFLQACDVYVVPYLNEAQITSGTLSYAVGAGAAVVSTPFWHAQELLEEDRGRLFDFRNSDQLATILNELLDQPEAMLNLRSKAHNYGKHLRWHLVGKQYLNLFRQIIAAQDTAKLKQEKHLSEYPQLNLQHLKHLTDDTGILQHAKYGIPNRFEGYCLDDNARALIAAIMGSRGKVSKWHQKAATTYLSYIHHCQNEDGTFRNFMSFDRQFLDEKGSEDSFGRALWALGYTIAYDHHGLDGPALEIFRNALPQLEAVKSPRSWAFSILGIYYFLKKHPQDEHLLNLLHQIKGRLCNLYKANREAGWHWFEGFLTYCNGMLPLSLFCSLELMPDEETEKIALESTAFLEGLTMINGYCHPIGCEKFYYKNQERSLYDQQPVDVMVNVMLFLQAHRVTGKYHFFQQALICMDWFHGKNSLHLPLYNAETGGCWDGLTPSGVNQNQGAESTLSYIIARQAMDRVLAAKAGMHLNNGKSSALTPQNGYVMAKVA